MLILYIFVKYKEAETLIKTEQGPKLNIWEVFKIRNK